MVRYGHCEVLSVLLSWRSAALASLHIIKSTKKVPGCGLDCAGYFKQWRFFSAPWFLSTPALIKVQSLIREYGKVPGVLMCIIWSFLWFESCLFHHFPSKPTYPGDLLKTPHSQAKTLSQKQWCLAPYYLSPEGTKGDPPDYCTSPVCWAHTGPRIVHTCSVLFKCSFTCWSPCKVPVKTQLKQKPSTHSRCRHLLCIAGEVALLSNKKLLSILMQDTINCRHLYGGGRGNRFAT